MNKFIQEGFLRRRGMGRTTVYARQEEVPEQENMAGGLNV